MDTTPVAVEEILSTGSGTGVRLEPFDHADFDRLIGWIPDTRFLLQFTGAVFTFPLTRAQLERHLTAAERRRNALVYKAVLQTSGEVVGHGELAAIDEANRSTFIARVLVGPPSLRGKGIGSRIVRQLLQLGFGELELHRGALHVFDFNRAAIECYERLGFQWEGTLRDTRRHGQEYCDVRIMSMLKPEWETNQPARR